MDARELLQGWPGFAKANAARVLASPAWRLETRYDGKPAVLTRCGGLPDGTDTISLAARFDDVVRTATFVPSPLFPDLWALRNNLKDLPSEVLLALVEKECGALFQFFEDLSRRSLSIAGLSEKVENGTSFTLKTGDGEIFFAVDLLSATEQQLGQLANLDVTHESIRSLTREVTATYAKLEMPVEEVAALATGDCLVLPADAKPAWELGIPADGAVRLVASEPRTVTFADLADDALGPVPPAERVRIVWRGRDVAIGEFSKLGEATVVKVAEKA